MNMAKDPAVLWYFNDWHGGTVTFSRHLKGCYMDLLYAQFNNGHLSIEEIKTVLGSDFGSTWPTLLKKFKTDATGNFFNEKLEEGMIKRKEYTESRRKNLSKNSHMKPHMDLHMDSHMENENENEIINKDELESEKNFVILEMKAEEVESNDYPTFEDFWDEYDKKVGDKRKVQKKWEKLSRQDREYIMDYIQLYKQATPDKQYRKHPETFLNNKSWNDEIIVSNGARQQTAKTDPNKFGKEIDELINQKYGNGSINAG